MSQALCRLLAGVHLFSRSSEKRWTKKRAKHTEQKPAWGPASQIILLNRRIYSNEEQLRVTSASGTGGEEHQDTIYRMSKEISETILPGLFAKWQLSVAVCVLIYWSNTLSYPALNVPVWRVQDDTTCDSSEKSSHSGCVLASKQKLYQQIAL